MKVKKQLVTRPRQMVVLVHAGNQEASGSTKNQKVLGNSNANLSDKKH
jgi:hypothetical protein